MNSISNERERISFLFPDTARALKGIAAVVVMLGHYLSWTAWYTRYLLPGDICVGLFFFFSGYGLRRSLAEKENYLDGFIAKRILPTYIPFCFAELFYIIAEDIMGSDISFADYILGTFGFSLFNSVLWFVLEICIVYLLFYFIYRKTSKDFVWIPLYALFMVVSMVLEVAFDIGTWWFISTSAFVIGLYLGGNRGNELLRFARRKTVFIFSVCATVFLYTVEILLDAPFQLFVMGSIPPTWVINICKMAVIPLSIICLLNIRWGSIGKARILSDLGQMSYDIYLWHMFSLMVVRHFVSSGISSVILSVCLTYLMSGISSKARGSISKIIESFSGRKERVESI